MGPATLQALSSPNCSPNLAWCSLNLPELLPEFDPALRLWGRPEPARWPGPSGQLGLEGGQAPLPMPLHRHGAHAQLLADPAEALALQHREPDDRRLPSREPIQQGRHASTFLRLLLLGRLQLIDPDGAAGQGGMQALVAPGVAAFLVLTPRDADQAADIAQVVEQGPPDAAPEIAGGRGWIGDLAAGEPELHLRHLPGIIELENAAAGRQAAGNGISEGKELLEEGIGLGWDAGHGLIA